MTLLCSGKPCQNKRDVTNTGRAQHWKPVLTALRDKQIRVNPSIIRMEDLILLPHVLFKVLVEVGLAERGFTL